MSYRAVLTGVGLYGVIYACLDRYVAVNRRICLYRLVWGSIVSYSVVYFFQF